MHVELKEDEPAVRTVTSPESPRACTKWQAMPFALMIRRVEDVLACTWHHVLDTSACLSDSDSPRSRIVRAKPLLLAHAGALPHFADLGRNVAPVSLA